jgi:hypothetical protein
LPPCTTPEPPPLEVEPPPPELWTTPLGGLWTTDGGGFWVTDDELGLDAGVATAGASDAFGRAAGLGRDFSAGVATSPCTAGTEARGAWIATGGASEVAVCGLGLDFVAMPTPNASANASAATAAGSNPRIHAGASL